MGVGATVDGAALLLVEVELDDNADEFGCDDDDDDDAPLPLLLVVLFCC